MPPWWQLLKRYNITVTVTSPFGAKADVFVPAPRMSRGKAIAMLWLALSSGLHQGFDSTASVDRRIIIEFDAPPRVACTTGFTTVLFAAFVPSVAILGTPYRHASSQLSVGISS